MAGYRQASKLLMDTSQSRRAKFTTNSIYVCPRGAPIWHFADKQITDTQLQNIADKYNQSDILLYIPATNNVYYKCNTYTLYYQTIKTMIMYS